MSPATAISASRTDSRRSRENLHSGRKSRAPPIARPLRYNEGDLLPRRATSRRLTNRRRTRDRMPRPPFSPSPSPLPAASRNHLQRAPGAARIPAPDRT